jgi:hypothetical protein
MTIAHEICQMPSDANVKCQWHNFHTSHCFHVIVATTPQHHHHTVSLLSTNHTLSSSNLLLLLVLHFTFANSMARYKTTERRSATPQGTGGSRVLVGRGRLPMVARDAEAAAPRPPPKKRRMRPGEQS